MDVIKVLFVLTAVFFVLFVQASVFSSNSRSKFSDACEKLMCCCLVCGIFCGIAL